MASLRTPLTSSGFIAQVKTGITAAVAAILSIDFENIAGDRVFERSERGNGAVMPSSKAALAIFIKTRLQRLRVPC